MDRIAALNEHYAVVDIGSYKRDTFVVEFNSDGEVVCIREFAAFKRLLYHEPEINIGKEYAPLAEAWLKSPDARRYRSLVFAPPGSSATFLEGQDYNLWRGLAVEPAPGDWFINRHHIKNVICAGNEEHERWLHNWIAAMLQKPGQHGWVAPVLKGGQGIGKGYFAHTQLGGMFRPRNYAHLTNPDHLTSDFNSHLEDRVYVFADEAFWGAKKAADRLKGLITESDIMINRKHVPQEIQSSALHIVIASNAERPLPVERDDRRLFVLQVSEEFKQDQDYFTALLDELEREGRPAMLDYFLSFQVEWDLLRLPPESDAKREMKAASLTTEDAWWRDVLEATDSQTWQPTKSRNELVTQYASWFDRFNGRGPKKNATMLGQYFAKHFAAGGLEGWPKSGKLTVTSNGSPSSRRENAWMFPVLSQCRAVFDRATGTRNDWPADEAEGEAAAFQLAKAAPRGR
jgi:hypothetical protein